MRISDYRNKPLPPEMIGEITLATGSHDKRGKALCVMELVAWLKGVEHSDAPPCVCPAIRSYTIRMNDKGPQWVRDALRDRVLKLVDTRSSVDLQKARLRVFAEAAIVTAEEVLPMFEARRPGDDRPRKAIQAAKDLLAGKISRAYAAYAADAASAASAAYAAYAASAADAASAAYAADAAEKRRAIWQRHLDALDAALALTEPPQALAA